MFAQAEAGGNELDSGDRNEDHARQDRQPLASGLLLDQQNTHACLHDDEIGPARNGYRTAEAACYCSNERV